METTSGLVIAKNPSLIQLHVIARRSKRRGARIIAAQYGTLDIPVCCYRLRAEQTQRPDRAEERLMSIGTIILIIALLGGFSGVGGGPFYGTGYYGGGGLGLVIVILLILLLLGKL
jgi:Protein of unknown function (DUF3309)